MSTNKRDGGEVEQIIARLREVAASPYNFREAFDRGLLASNAADALAESRAEVATEKGRREHTQQWYAERLAKIEEVAKREGLWPEIAAIIANGSGTRQLPNGSYVYDPPTYAQQLNSAKHKEERAEARAERLAGAGRRVTAAFRAHAKTEGWAATRDSARECENAMLALDAALEQEPHHD